MYVIIEYDATTGEVSAVFDSVDSIMKFRPRIKFQDDEKPDVVNTRKLYYATTYDKYPVYYKIEWVLRC